MFRGDREESFKGTSYAAHGRVPTRCFNVHGPSQRVSRWRMGDSVRKTRIEQYKRVPIQRHPVIAPCKRVRRVREDSEQAHDDVVEVS